MVSARLGHVGGSQYGLERTRAVDINAAAINILVDGPSFLFRFIRNFHPFASDINYPRKYF